MEKKLKELDTSNQEDPSEKECYVAFIDIIGFSELITNSDSRQKIIIYLLRLWYTAAEKQQNPLFKFQIKTISDSIIIYTDLNNESLNWLIYSVAILQSQFLENNILTRGGISSGSIIDEKHLNILYGKGLVNAYNLEKSASVPRVILDTKIVFNLNQNNQSMCDFTMKQFTSRNNTPISHSFLKQPNKNNSYFKACHVDYFTLKIIDCFDNINPLLNIYNFLKESIYVKQKDVEKYYWIANELVANMDNYSSNKSNHYFSSHHELEEFCKMKEKFEGI